jgi:hypothetical protein
MTTLNATQCAGNAREGVNPSCICLIRLLLRRDGFFAFSICVNFFRLPFLIIYFLFLAAFAQKLFILFFWHQNNFFFFHSIFSPQFFTIFCFNFFSLFIVATIFYFIFLSFQFFFTIITQIKKILLFIHC